MNMQRIRMGSTTPITLELVDGQGDPPSPLPDTATLTITASDGTVLAMDANADSLGNAEFSYTLAPPITSTLDGLTVVWTNTQVGSFTEHLEIVGDSFFAISELRAMSSVLQNTTTYPQDTLVAMRTTVEDAIEREVGYAMVPRYTIRKVTADSPLSLAPYLRSIRVVTSDDDTIVDPATLTFSDGGFVYGYPSSSWPGAAHVTVGFEHGTDRPPERIRRAALLLAKTWLINGPIDDRTTSFTSPDTGITSTMVTPGLRGSVFGIPEVDAAVLSERLVPIG